MTNHTSNHNDGSLSEDTYQSKLTYCDELLLQRLTPKSMAFLQAQGLSFHLSQDILYATFEKLREKSIFFIFDHLIGFFVRQRIFFPNDEEVFKYLKTLLRRMVADHFRHTHARKRDERQHQGLSEYGWSVVEDLSSLDPYTWCEAIDLCHRTIHLAKKLLYPANLSKFSPRERIVISVAKRAGLSQLKRSGLYALLEEAERSSFLPLNGKAVDDEEKTIKTAIYKTVVKLPVTTAKILRQNQSG